MTKAEWISTIKNTLKPIDETDRLHEPFLEAHIGAVYEQMYNELYRQDKKGIWKYVIDFTEDTGSGVDLTGGYSMENTPISLPRDGGGLFRFGCESSKSYVITSYQGVINSDISAFDTIGMKGQYFVALRGGKLYGNDDDIAASETMTFSIIPKFQTLSSTDEVMIPGGMEDHFIDRVIMTIKQMPPMDLLNDNA